MSYDFGETLRCALERRLGRRYEIGVEIGRGATAIVYAAHDQRLARDVAIKVLRPDVEGAARRRFSREITMLAGLQHPSILPLHDCGSFKGVQYFVTPFVEGDSLRHRLARDGRLPIQDAIRIAIDLSDALDHIHQRGIVHRDVKPENILLTGSRAILADFGIARLIVTSRSTRITDEGYGIPGTLLYMSPEQKAGIEPANSASDIYSLGIVLLEMLTGEVPRWAAAYVGDNAENTARRQLVRCLRDDLPRAVESSLLRALQPNPRDRFLYASEFSASLAPDNSRETGLFQTAQEIRVGLSNIISRLTSGIRRLRAGSPGEPLRREYSVATQ